VDVLIVVEDPGAANFILDLPGALANAGVSSRIVSCGHAAQYLKDRHVASDSYPASLHPGEFVNAHPFRLLLAGTSQNPDSPVLALIDECRRRNLPTIGFVDMAADAHLRFSGRAANPLQHAPESIIVADPATRGAFEDLGFPADRIHVSGHPAYDRVRQRAAKLAKGSRSALRTRLLGGDPAPRPVWVFAAEHGEDDPRQKRSAEYTLHGRGGSDRRTDIVLEEVLDAASALEPRPYVALRLHPKNTREEFARYVSEVDIVSQGGDPIELIWASDLVLGMSSILLMEAAVAGRPTLSVVPRECERIWSPSVMEGLTRMVFTREQLKSAVLTASCPTNSRSTDSDPISNIVAFTQSELSGLPR
jgi:hypothetical protein